MTTTKLPKPTIYTSERLHKRDLHYSERHRTYGKLPATDIDMIEYDDFDNAAILIEEKHGQISSVYLHESRKQQNVANKLEVPFFIVVYYFLHLKPTKRPLFVLIDADQELSIDHVQYFVIPANKLAAHFLPQAKQLTEKEYIRFLHHIKQSTPPDLTSDQFFDHLLSEDHLITYPPMVYQ